MPPQQSLSKHLLFVFIVMLAFVLLPPFPFTGPWGGSLASWWLLGATIAYTWLLFLNPSARLTLISSFIGAAYIHSGPCIDTPPLAATNIVAVLVQCRWWGPSEFLSSLAVFGTVVTATYVLRHRAKRETPLLGLFLGFLPFGIIALSSSVANVSAAWWMLATDNVTAATMGVLLLVSCGWLPYLAIAALRESQGKPMAERMPVPPENGGRRRGFTLIELLIVIGIMATLAVFIFGQLNGMLDRAYAARAKAELSQIAKATQQLVIEQGAWPPDVDRSVPPGIEEYLGPGNWPQAPWPGAVYDWDNIDLGNGVHYYQISIRFCPLGQPSLCRFPAEPWAKDFDYYSSAYHCMGGPCRSHSSKPPDHPGYCMNC